MSNNVNTMMATSDRMASLKSEINRVEESLISTKAGRDAAYAERYDAKISIKSLKSSHGQRDLSSQAQNDLDALTRRHEDASEALKQADSLHQELSSKLTALTSEFNKLADCTHNITLDDVMAVQSDIQKAQNEVDEIQALISKHNTAIQAGVESRQTLNELYQKRDDLRAELALGNASKADLTALDKEISAEKEKADSTDTKAKEAQYTVQGLQRKLIPALGKVDELQSTSRAVVVQFFQGKLGRLVAEYSQQAQPLIETFKQVHALNQFMVDKFKRPTVAGASHMQMCIPAFSMKAVNGVVSPAADVVFSFRQGMDRGEFVGIEIDGVKQIQELGFLN